MKMFGTEKKLSETLKPGDKLMYPSVSGIALLGQVTGVTEKDIIIQVNGKQHYVEKDSIDAHALLIPPEKAKVYVSQRIEDPENQIVYLRVHYIETWIDRLYNWYCQILGRPTKQVIDRNAD